MGNPIEEHVVAGGSSVPRRVWRGTGLLVFGRVYGSTCTFFALWLLARSLSPDAFGRYTFYLTVFVLLDTLVDFGTGQIAVQRTAADPGAVSATLAATRRIRLAMGVLGVGLVGGMAFARGEEGAAWILLASLYPVTHVFELSSTVFRNRITLGVPVIARAVASTLSLAFVALLLWAGDRAPAHLLCATALGSTSGNAILHVAARAHLPRETPERVPVLETWLAAWPLGIAALCQQAYFYADNLFIDAWRGAEELGAYNIAMRVLSILIVGAILTTQAALPWLTREHAAGRLGDAISNLAQPLFLLAGLGTGFVVPWSDRVLAIFGPHFLVAGPSLRWLLAATMVIYAGAALLTALVAAGRSRSILAIAAAALATNVALNAVLVPRHGIEGSAAATLATEALVAACGAFVLARAGVGLGRRAWGWLGGPAGFAIAWLASSALRPA